MKNKQLTASDRSTSARPPPQPRHHTQGQKPSLGSSCQLGTTQGSTAALREAAATVASMPRLLAMLSAETTMIKHNQQLILTVGVVQLELLGLPVRQREGAAQ